MLLQKESLKKIDACWGSYVYHRLAKFQAFLILATLIPHSSLAALTPHPPPLTPYSHPSPLTPHPSLLTHSSTRKEMERLALFLLPNSNSSLVLYFRSACDRSFVSFPVSAAA